MSHSFRQYVILILFIVIVYFSVGEGNVESIESSIQHPKHQPQDSNINSVPLEAQESNLVIKENEQKLDDSHVATESIAKLAPGGETDTKVHVGVPKTNEFEDGEKLPDSVVESSDGAPGSSEIVIDGSKEAPLNEHFDTKNEVGDKDLSSKTVKETIPTESEIPPDEVGEDTPLASFKEFREQMEKEKEKKTIAEEKRGAGDIDDSTPDKPKSKFIQKNYADNSCGAKIVDKKKEFKNCGTILNNNKDLYAMIPCEGPIWFVIELCDTIQINALQLANYELFSSSIKEFKVYTSETYPPKEWKHLGTFETTNSRQIQKFNIENHSDYSKYVKFEKISSRGKEHFCVLSTFEVLGMSMVDEYEEVQANHQDLEMDSYELPLDGDDFHDAAPTDKSLYQGAKDTVKNIVDSALNVLGVSKNEQKDGNATVPSMEEHSAGNELQEPAIKPTEESVIIKVDEKGKEIKVDDAPERRLKGEEENEISDTGSVAKQEPPPSIPDREPIMEAVDLSKDDDEIVSPPLKSPEEAKVEINEELEIHSSSPDLKGDSKAQDKSDKSLEIPEPKIEGAAPEKGVIMTNSPKKNSIFVELDKKIKELEKNLSLSNDYLETLSSRYKRVDQSFKPLQKTLTTIDGVMTNFEERLKNLETQFEKFEDSLHIVLRHLEDSKTKSNSLITTTNLIIFLLLIMLYFFWRLSYKVNQISYCVLDKPVESKATYISDEIAHKQESSHTSKKRQRTKHPKESGGFSSRDTSPRPPLLSFKSESNIQKKVGNDSKKPLESVQMDLIYPQSKSPTLKRRAKHVR